MRRISNHRLGGWPSILLLAVLLFRAYVPAGFMPASGAPFALELCPVGMAGMPTHLHHHLGTHGDFETCPFGSAPGGGPISHHVAFESAGPPPAQFIAAFQPPLLTLRLPKAHQPRGPPSLA
jgi:hypothetical protein